VLQTEIKVIQKGTEWWVMTKSLGIPDMLPVGQRLVRMAYPRILEVVHKTEEKANREADWLKEHLVNWQTKVDKRMRKAARQTS
jgi:hypothetical protein